MRKVLAAGAAVLVALSLSACGPRGGYVDSDPFDGWNSPVYYPGTHTRVIERRTVVHHTSRIGSRPRVGCGCSSRRR